ncbi:MAG: TlpA family protein disulfide reductase [Planctomycetes bacterium]|nr:TlpA family protein disulfide reductase [Planctomycetota bacterium]
MTALSRRLALSLGLAIVCPSVVCPVVASAEDAPSAAAAFAALEKELDAARRVPPASRRRAMEDLMATAGAFLDQHRQAATQDQLLKAGGLWFELASATNAPEQALRDRIAQLRALPEVPAPLAGAMRGVEARLDLKPGRPAPAWTAVDIRDGSEVTLESLRGKLVLMDFWATWCGPCIGLMDQKLKPLHERTKDDDRFVLVSIGVPWSGETVEKERDFAEKKGFHWKKVFDATGDVPQAYGVQGIPTLVLVDTDGKILSIGVGGAVIGEIERIIAERLAEPRGE